MNFFIFILVLVMTICFVICTMCLGVITEQLEKIANELEDGNRTHTKLTKVLYLFYKEKKNGNSV